MYTGYLLSENDRNKLASLFPPKNPTWLGHHITETFGVDANHPPPKKPSSVMLIEYLEEDGIEGFLASVDGTVNRPSGGKYHLTWSIDKGKGRKPVDTNNIVDQGKKLSKPIPLNVEPKTFTKSTEKSLKEYITFLDYLKDYT